MNKFAVYIPSKLRAHHLKKTMPAWLAQPVQVRILLDGRKDERDYRKELRDINGGNEVELIVLPKEKMGMGAIRQYALAYAAAGKEDAFLMCDDDALPAEGNANHLAVTTLAKEVVGCGASSSYHGLMVGNDVLKLDATFPIAGGFGHIMFGVNTDLAVALGGFPKELTCWGEDTELQRQGIADGRPWYYTTRVRMRSIAKRYSPGGLASYKNRTAEEKKCHSLIHGWWPDFVSHPDTGRFRCAWKRMQEHYIPGWERQVPRRVKEAMAR